MNKHGGYSLIEIIVVITIGAILSSVGLFGINNLNRRQVVVQNAKTIVSEIRKTKSLADVQQKPENCETLNGYSLKIVGGKEISIWAVCDYLDETNKYYEHQSRITTATLAGMTEVFFPVLQQPATFIGSNQLTIEQNGQTITLNIGITGVVDYE